MAIFCWFISFIQIVFLLVVERKIFKQKLMSPTLILGVPFLVVTLFSIIFGESLGFISLTKEIFIVWWIGILFFWSGGVINKIITPNKKMVHKSNLINSTISRKLCICITIITSLSILIKAYQLYWGSSLDVFASNEFSAKIAQGIYGWLRIPLLICFTYILCTFRLKKLSLFEILAIALGAATIVIYQIKGITLLPLVSCVLYNYLNNNKIFSPKVVRYSLIIALIVFYVAYALPYILSGDYSVLVDSVFYKNIVLKVTMYFWAGILAFCEFVNKGIEPSEPWYIIISPIYNAFRRLWGGEAVAPETSYFLPVGSNFSSNVFTIFGTIFIFTNYFGLIVFSLLMGFFSYWCMKISLIHYFNKWYKMAYAMILFYLLMGTFDYFFYHSYVLIILALVYIIGFISERGLRKNKILVHKQLEDN